MSSDMTFLLALVLLIAGSGFLKGNISAQVGTLYPPESESLRERGFAIFSTGINIGAVAGPLVTGAVAAIYGSHAGFAVAAGLMLIALAIYLAGQRYLPNKAPRRTAASDLPPLTTDEKGTTWSILALIVLVVPAAISYTMIWNVGIVWIDEKVSLGPVPASWFNSVDSFASILIAPALVGLWASQARRDVEPSALTKMIIGFAITGASALFFVAGSLLAGPDSKVSVLWAIAGYFGMGAAFMWYWPVLLAVVSKAAPAKINSTLVSGSFLAFFVGTVLMGWIGSFYEQLSNAAFWGLDASFAIAGAALLLLFKRPMTKALNLSPE